MSPSWAPAADITPAPTLRSVSLRPSTASVVPTAVTSPVTNTGGIQFSLAMYAQASAAPAAPPAVLSVSVPQVVFFSGAAALVVVEMVRGLVIARGARMVAALRSWRRSAFLCFLEACFVLAMANSDQGRDVVRDGRPHRRGDSAAPRAARPRATRPALFAARVALGSTLRAVSYTHLR